MAPLESDNPFWRFSLRVYAAPGVAQECLTVQDRFGADVNRLLFAAWLGAARGVILEDAGLRRIDAAVDEWTKGIVQPLRAVRRLLKQNPDIDAPDMQALRKRVVETELLAEQTEQAMLYRLAKEFEGSSVEASAHRNVALFLAAHGPEAAAFAVPSLLAAAGDET